MKIISSIDWKMFRLLLVGGILGTLCVFPYVLTLQADQLANLPISIPIVLGLSLLQTSILLTIAIFIGLYLGKKVNLEVQIKSELKKTSLVSMKWGLLVGVLIIGLDQVFALFIEPITAISPPIWQGFLASFYGAIIEEILLRLFLMTLLVWIFSKFTQYSVWAAIIISSLLFGLGHLPTTSLLTTLTPIIIIRALLLNGIGGIIFGWLYWKKGLASAMIAHFSADITLHVVFPIVLLII